jgi:hypothetical protein
MRLLTINHALITADCHAVQHLQNTSHPTARSICFNTARHTRLDILPVVPESTSSTRSQPPWTAHDYVLWQPPCDYFP